MPLQFLMTSDLQQGVAMLLWSTYPVMFGFGFFQSGPITEATSFFYMEIWFVSLVDWVLFLQ